MPESLIYACPKQIPRAPEFTTVLSSSDCSAAKQILAPTAGAFCLPRRGAWSQSAVFGVSFRGEGRTLRVHQTRKSAVIRHASRPAIGRAAAARSQPDQAEGSSPARQVFGRLYRKPSSTGSGAAGSSAHHS